MTTKDLEFKIDAWTPDTIPQSRLGQYLIELARLYGEPESVHFRKLRKGSAVVVSCVVEQARPKVQRRLLELGAGSAPKEAVDAYKKIDDMLALDNATGLIRGLDQGNVLQFPGRQRPRPVEYGAVREESFIEGEIVRLGGRDQTIHVALQDGETVYSAIETDRDTARRLGPLIFGPTVRLWGTGTWKRLEAGGWQLDRFVVARFEQVTSTLHDSIDRIRAIDGSEWGTEPDPVASVLASRTTGEFRKLRKP